MNERGDTVRSAGVNREIDTIERPRKRGLVAFLGIVICE